MQLAHAARRAERGLGTHLLDEDRDVVCAFDLKAKVAVSRTDAHELHATAASALSSTLEETAQCKQAGS